MTRRPHFRVLSGFGASWRAGRRRTETTTEGRIKERTLRGGRGVVSTGVFDAFGTLLSRTTRCARAANGGASTLLHTLRGFAMSDEREFRVRPGRIRSTRAQQARPFVAQALAAARKAGGGVSRFGSGQATSLQASRRITRRSCVAVMKARIVRHTARTGSPVTPSPISAVGNDTGRRKSAEVSQALDRRAEHLVHEVWPSGRDGAGEYVAYVSPAPCARLRSLRHA